jgi:hypothetical protein
LLKISFTFSVRIIVLVVVPPIKLIKALENVESRTKANGTVIVLVIAKSGHLIFETILTFFFVTRCSIVKAIINTTISIKLMIIAPIKYLNNGALTLNTKLCPAVLKNISPILAPAQKLNA